MAGDPVNDYLKSFNTSDRVRDVAWEAVYAAREGAIKPEELNRRLKTLPFSDEVRDALWAMGHGEPPPATTGPYKPASAEQFTPQTEQPSSPISRFLTNAVVNPVVGTAQFLGQTLRPYDLAKNIWSASAEQGNKAKQAFQEGHYTEAAGRAAATLPIVGPAMGHAADQFLAGDVAGGLGTTTSLVAPLAVSAGLRGRTAYRANRGDPAILERQAAQQVSQKVLAPGNVAFKGKAEAIAPEILKRGMTGSREVLAQAADEGMATAGQAIDDAIQAGGGGQSAVVIDPIIGRLQAKLDSLMIRGEPIRGAEGRVAGLRARIEQLERTARQARQPKGLTKAGPAQGAATPQRAMSFDDLRRYRDEQYRLADEARGYARMGNDRMGDEAFAARETGGEIRQEFANLSPDLAAANADYAFFKTLGDVLDPAQGRPKATTPTQGVTGGAATTGAVVGNMISPKVAFVLGVVRPWVKKMQSGPEWQLADAHAKMRLAQAIQKGDLSTAQTLMTRLAAGAGFTSQRGPQTQTTGSGSSQP